MNGGANGHADADANGHGHADVDADAQRRAAIAARLQADAADSKRALVLYCSHIGGHKYAGNVIVRAVLPLFLPLPPFSPLLAHSVPLSPGPFPLPQPPTLL